MPKQLEDVLFTADKSVWDKAAVGSVGDFKAASAKAASRTFSLVCRKQFWLAGTVFSNSSK
jgi:hypothetical protein